MANIQVNIEVPEDDFKGLCLDRINDLPKDKMEELLLKAVEIALIADKENPYYLSNTSILVVNKRNEYGTIKWEPTELMKQIIKEINTEGYLEPIAKEVAEYIKENYKSMVREYIIEAFTRMLFSQENEWNIKTYINDVMASRR